MHRQPPPPPPFPASLRSSHAPLWDLVRWPFSLPPHPPRSHAYARRARVAGGTDRRRGARGRPPHARGRRSRRWGAQGVGAAVVGPSRRPVQHGRGPGTRAPAGAAASWRGPAAHPSRGSSENRRPERGGGGAWTGVLFADPLDWSRFCSLFRSKMGD